MLAIGFCLDGRHIREYTLEELVIVHWYPECRPVSQSHRAVAVKHGATGAHSHRFSTLLARGTMHFLGNLEDYDREQHLALLTCSPAVEAFPWAFMLLVARSAQGSTLNHMPLVRTPEIFTLIYHQNYSPPIANPGILR
jgi:hypothetical protein